MRVFWVGHNAVRDWIFHHRAAALASWIVIAALLQVAAR